MTFRPYLMFSGDCRAAFTRYHEILGGDLTVLTMADIPADAGGPPDGASADLVMHAALVLGDHLLMGSDDPTGDGGPKVGILVSYTVDEPAEARRVFDALADGGLVHEPVTETFFSPAFGICTDRFGIPWMIMAEPPEAT